MFLKGYFHAKRAAWNKMNLLLHSWEITGMKLNLTRKCMQLVWEFATQKVWD